LEVERLNLRLYAAGSLTDRPNHVLHAILTIFTCLLWGIVWLLMPSRPERRISWVADEAGQSWSIVPEGSQWESFVA
jgi:hypothetical protein